ncbi:MAG TPA: hypothetical protein VND64_35015 [Pirellulales bacterium]|nr:hypothetical protein [Pirellulales bacterium]
MLMLLASLRKKGRDRRRRSLMRRPGGPRLEGLEQRALLHGIAAAAAPATQFELIAPANVASGTAATLEVVALNASNQPARNYSGTVHFTTTDTATGAAVPADYMFSAGDHGIHFFQMTLDTTGSETVTATDTATSSITGSVTVTVNPAQVATHFGLFAPSQVIVGQATSVEVVALDAANHRVAGYTGTVDVSAGDANATVAPMSYAFTAADHGEHVFQATLTVAGTEVITATDAATSTVTGSISLSVTPAPAATHLGLLVPEYAAAGQPTNVEVVALDASNHLVQGYTGTVQLTSGDSAATLPSSYTFSASDHGVHRFQVTFGTTGSQTVTAADTADNLTSTVTLVVNPAPVATHFAVLAHANAASGTAVNVIVVALDASNHPVSGYTGTVHFTSGDSAATLPADYTFTAGDHGYHLFQVTFATAGSETLTVTDTAASSLAGTITVNVQTPLPPTGGGGGGGGGTGTGGGHMGWWHPPRSDAVFADMAGGGRHWRWRD